MARFTNIGMPRKAFVPSAAEDSRSPADAGPSTSPQLAAAPEVKKRKRRGTRGKQPPTEESVPEKKGWGRDPTLAKRAKLSATHSESRRMKRENERYTATTCFACRGVGHAARDCPNVLLATMGGGSADMLEEGGGEGEGEGERREAKGKGKGMKRKGGKKGGEVAGGRCYRCNATDHPLSKCPEPVDPANPTPFATCFICLSTGHLSSLCPSNSRGVYVNGGSCKICGKTAHRAKDCPDLPEDEKKKSEPREKGREREVVMGGGKGVGADEDDFMVHSRDRGEEKGKKKKHPPAKNGERGVKKAAGVVGLEDGGAKARPPAADTERPVAALPKAGSKPKVVSF